MLRSKASMKQMNSTESDNYLNWSSTQEGVFFSGQNAGVLIVLIAGNYLDRFNRKWTIAISISLVVISNIVVPLLSHKAFLFGIFGRLLVGIADMLLQISSSSMITRWFPPKERPFAIGLITGGRQIGSVTIFFLGGYLCYHSTWQVNFYLSSAIAGGVLVIWVLLSADEPKGQLCINSVDGYDNFKTLACHNLGNNMS
uniref:Major facilitator superfamily (MFS) profile domain-containing protein n=1 Tax=Acrobeloides nanus TaxID=290746 RepID=A0A914CV69_9BILA